ncbi:MAG: hypothetical protein JXR71_10770 [Bacteroidales bacterium]|nr:hypothetical protein [Bacteroidales bacterium]
MKKFKLGLVLSFLLIASVMSAQEINSPYSRFGIGQLTERRVGTQIQSMGGISIGFADPYIINPGNPASYGVYDSLTFVFQSGIEGGFGTLKNTQNSSSYNHATLNEMVMGFPINKWWHVSMGVIPFSKVGYDVVESETIPGYAAMTSERWGTGGLSELYLGHSINLGKNLRIGLNMNYLFGNKSRYNIIYNSDSASVFSAKTEDYMSASGILLDWGLQYDIHFKNNQVLTLGATYRNSATVSAYHTTLSTTLFGGYGSQVDDIKDTVQYIPRENGNLKIPESIGLGFTYRKTGNWMFGGEMEWQNWSKYRAFGQADSLQNSLRLAVGGELTPTHTNISPLSKRMTYRLGLRFNQSYVRLNGRSINEFALTGGVKMPFRRSRSNLNLGFEIGSRGTLNNNLVKESFINFTFGINIVETWFYKQRYR